MTPTAASYASQLAARTLTNSYARARRELDEFRRSIARSTNEKVVLFGAMGWVVLNTDIADADLRAAIFRQVLSENELAAAVDDAERTTRPLDDNYFDLLGERYSHLRQFAPALLDALSLHGSAPDDDLLDAIDLLRRLNQTGRRRVADSAPTNFVPARWQSYVIDTDGRIDRRYHELCALWELRAALRAGDVCRALARTRALGIILAWARGGAGAAPTSPAPTFDRGHLTTATRMICCRDQLTLCKHGRQLRKSLALAAVIRQLLERRLPRAGLCRATQVRRAHLRNCGPAALIAPDAERGQ